MKMHWFAMQVEPLLSKNKGSLKDLTLAQKGAFTMLLALAAKLNESGKFIWNGDPLSEKDIVTFTGITNKRDRITMFVTIRLLLDLEILEKVQSTNVNVPEKVRSDVLNVSKKVRSEALGVLKKHVQVVYAFQKWDVYQNYWESRKHDFEIRKDTLNDKAKNTQYTNTETKKETNNKPLEAGAVNLADKTLAFKTWYGENYESKFKSKYLNLPGDDKHIDNLLAKISLEVLKQKTLLAFDYRDAGAKSLSTLGNSINRSKPMGDLNEIGASSSHSQPQKWPAKDIVGKITVDFAKSKG